MASKNEQDLILHGLIDAIDVQQRRPSTKEDVQHKGLKSATFSYHVLVGKTRKERGMFPCFSLGFFLLAKKEFEGLET